MTMTKDEGSTTAIQRLRRKEAEKMKKYLDDKLRKKTEEIERLRSPLQTWQERQQEFDKRIALCDARATQLVEDDRDFMNKPMPSTLPFYGKPSTFYPSPYAFKLLLTAIMKVDEAVKTYKAGSDLMTINNVNRAFTHFACILCDTVETDQAKQALQREDDTGVFRSLNINHALVSVSVV